MTHTKELFGVIAPIHTPFNNDFSIDTSGLGKFAAELCEAGVHGIMVGGSAGEFPSLSEEERRVIAEAVVREVGDRIPVMVQIAHSDLKVVIRLAQHARSIGAAAVLCLPPILLNPPQEEIYRYFAMLAEKADIDVGIYNNPGRTNITVEPGTIVRLAKLERIRYLKDSGRNMRHTSDIIQDTADQKFVVLSGEGDLFLSILAIGGKGGIIVPALLVPRKAVTLYKASTAGDYALARKIHYQIMELVRFMGSEGRWHAAMKAALRIQGKPSGFMRPPMSDVSDALKERIREALRKIEAE